MATATAYQKRMAKGNIDSWKRSSYYSIHDAYGRCSMKKQAAWDYCNKLCDDNNGRDLKVISHNTYMFTAGFEFDDPETGVLMFMFITPSYDVAVEM